MKPLRIGMYFYWMILIKYIKIKRDIGSFYQLKELPCSLCCGADVRPRVVVDPKMGSRAVFMFRRMLQMRGRTLRDSLAGLDFRGTCGETGIR